MALCDPGIAFAALSFLEIFAARLCAVDQIEFETVSRNFAKSEQLASGWNYLSVQFRDASGIVVVY
jgi:hypothetical protein